MFDTIVRNAVKLCRGRFANAFRYDGEQLHLVATTRKSVEALKALAERYPMRPHERQASGRAILAKATVEIEGALADSAYDHRIALNLLSNAVKFTPDGGRVDVSAKLDMDKVEISVKDTAVGISLEDQASLFEEFKQFGKDRSRKAEGTGLGLALTKRLVELHGG